MREVALWPKTGPPRDGVSDGPPLGRDYDPEPRTAGLRSPDPEPRTTFIRFTWSFATPSASLGDPCSAEPPLRRASASRHTPGRCSATLLLGDTRYWESINPTGPKEVKVALFLHANSMPELSTSALSTCNSLPKMVQRSALFQSLAGPRSLAS